MKAEIQQEVNLMASNFQSLKQAFAWDNQSIKHFGALISATRDTAIDPERVKATRIIIKENTTWTSYFRGNNELMLAMLLCNESGYEQRFLEMKQIHETLKDHGFKSSIYLPLAAYVIGMSETEQSTSQIYQRMNDFYTGMKANHFWLTTGDDYVMAAVLALSDKDVQKTLADMEACYTYLNQSGLYKGNELQSLSHILALGEGETALKCDRAIYIYKGLKERKCRLYYQGLSMLGVLSLLNEDPGQLVDEIAEVYDALYRTEGYGFWGIDSNLRAILAASIVADYYADTVKKEALTSTLVNSLSSIIIAQQAATMAAVTAATTAATASASS